MSTRGIRNNNPANIRRGSYWRGLVKQPTDKEFCQFISMPWGVRALLITLRTYVVKHHLHAVREIITRWAPPTDGNNTKMYILYVEKAIDDVNELLSPSLQDIDFMSRYQHPECILYIVAKAMCKIESGYNLEYTTYLTAFFLM